MNKIYIYHHLGLGDFISCNGIVRSIVKENKKSSIFVFCKKDQLKIVKFMYRDENKIKLIPIKTKNNTEKEFSYKIEKHIKRVSKKSKIIKIGFSNFNDIYNKFYSYRNPITYDMVFYKQLKIPYKKRFSECYWKRDKRAEDRVFKKLIKDKDKMYAFVHDDESLGYKINDNFVTSGLKIIRNDKNENIFNMAKVIENADELHFMESSLRNMAETLNIKSKKIYLYIWRRRKIAPIYSPKLKKVVGVKKKWKIVFTNPQKKNFKFYIMNNIIKLRFFVLGLIS